MHTFFVNIQKLLHDKMAGLLAIAACFAIQSAYGFFYCTGGVSTFWMATPVAQLPAIGLLFTRHRSASPIAAAVIQMFCLWANSMECRPYTGGGAAMAYVVVLLYGWPAAIFAGALLPKLWDMAKGDNDASKGS